MRLLRLLRLLVGGVLLLLILSAGYALYFPLPSDSSLVKRLNQTVWVETGITADNQSYRATFRLLDAQGQPAGSTDRGCPHPQPTSKNYAAMPGPQPLVVELLLKADEPGSTPICAQGTWEVRDGRVKQIIAGAGLPLPDFAQVALPTSASLRIVALSTRELVYSFEDNRRGPVPAERRVLQRVDDLNKSAFQTAFRPAEAVRSPIAQETTLVDSPLYVPSKNVRLVSFDLKDTSNLRLRVDVEGVLPLDVILLPRPKGMTERSLVALYEQLKSELRRQSAGEAFEGIFNDAHQKLALRSFTEDGLFDVSLAKRGVFRVYKAEASGFPKGSYLLVLDNTGDYTPTRGDAPAYVHLVATKPDASEPPNPAWPP